MDAQNVYYTSGTHSKVSDSKWIKNGLENVVFQFQKTPCSTELNSMKCMGNARGDQFNSELTVI